MSKTTIAQLQAQIQELQAKLTEAAKEPDQKPHPMAGWDIKLSADKKSLSFTVPLTLNYGHTTQRRTGYVLAGDFKSPLEDLGLYAGNLRLLVRPPVIMAMPPKGEGLPRV